MRGGASTCTCLAVPKHLDRPTLKHMSLAAESVFRKNCLSSDPSSNIPHSILLRHRALADLLHFVRLAFWARTPPAPKYHPPQNLCSSDISTPRWLLHAPQVQPSEPQQYDPVSLDSSKVILHPAAVGFTVSMFICQYLHPSRPQTFAETCLVAWHHEQALT